ncbi:MAG: nucleotidyltransferase family protein, partial [Methylocystis sp.]|nr:nucleotidyltransferase family protein [Methylocystis sp.]
MTPPPEIALLLAAAAPAPPPSFGALCARVLNWRALLDAADHHGLIPLLARAVVSAGPDAAPPAIVESLAASQADAVKRALYYEAELNRLSDAFRRAGLDFIPLKGPTLARALYDDPAL